jgi:hypothetical protein
MRPPDRRGHLGVLDTLPGVILTGERVALRPGEEDDVRRLEAILNEPEVAIRWGSIREC